MSHSHWWSLCVLAFAGFQACAEENTLVPGEGFVAVPGGEVWYRVTGDGVGVPVVLLHGGPGMPSYYMQSLAALGNDRPVIFYDQLGAGRSSQPNDTTLWRTERFVEEIVRLREALRLDAIHLLGHSWGSMLAMEYLLTEPAGVRSVVFASPLFSTDLWLRDADSLIATLPDSMQSAILSNEAAGTYDVPEYLAAVDEYYRRYLSRADPWPAEMDSTFANGGLSVYNYMWGPSEFTATGTLRTFDRLAELEELDLPVLFTVGRFDEAMPRTVEFYSSLVPNSRVELFESSAHMTMVDEPFEYARRVAAFLREVDSTSSLTSSMGTSRER